jgi:UDP-glucose 4-epimerase
VRFLVTGATGFIGRRVITKLLTAHPPEDIVCLVKRSAIPAEMAAESRYQKAGIRIIEGDLDDPSVSREAAPQADVILHLAANIDTALPESQIRVNDIGVENLLNWLKPISRGARIVYTSSIAVHDRNGAASGPIVETSPYTPRTDYGITKLRGEHILEARAKTDGFTYTFLRLATVYGPGSKQGGMFDLLFKMTSEGSLGGRIDWPGRTSIIHVDDTADLIIGIAKIPEAANQVYCVANAEAPTVGQLAQRIGRISGHPVNPIALPNWMWSAIRGVIWSAPVRALTPKSAALVYWRLSLIVDHGFWYDTRKLQSVWAKPPRDVDEAIADMLAARKVPIS